MITSWPAGGSICPKWTVRPWAKRSAAPGSRFGATSLLVDRVLHVVGQEERDELGAAHGLGERAARCRPASSAAAQERAALAEADLDLDAGVAQVERVRVALAP